MLSTQVVYALYSLALFMNVKPVTGIFFLNSCLYNKSGNSDSPEHSHVHSVTVSLHRDRLLLPVTLNLKLI